MNRYEHTYFRQMGTNYGPRSIDKFEYGDQHVSSLDAIGSVYFHCPNSSRSESHSRSKPTKRPGAAPHHRTPDFIRLV